MFTGDAVTVARLATDGSGGPILDLTVDARAAAALADATRGHVGEYLAVALDGVAVAVPTINEEIVDGGLQLGFAATTRRRPGLPRSCRAVRCRCRSRLSRPEARDRLSCQIVNA